MASTARRSIVLAAAVTLVAPPAGGARAEADPAPRQAAARPAPIALAVPSDLAAAVKAAADATGATVEALEGVPPAEGQTLAMKPGIAERLLEGSHATFRKAGLFLFRYERGFGVADDKDRVGVLKTGDWAAVVRRMKTAAPHHQLTTEGIVTWLAALAKDEPFELWEIGPDYVAGRFERTPRDPVAVARRCAEFAPDLVAGRASTLDLLANEIRTNRTLYLIW